MNELIQDGFGLLVLGMGFVFLFLVLLIFATRFMSTLLIEYFPEAVPVAKTSNVPAGDKPAVQAQDEHLKAVITAAIHQHRNRR
ncbi:OadG family protein [Marinomonas sp. 2405UD68-3]|uniref:OadG family protein n=1 Tax=Marinomonas sp. 2405UD68-3 TaxID=3391835 RepID=UPI0039C98116